MIEAKVQEAASDTSGSDSNEYLALHISDDDDMYSTRSRTSTRRYQRPAERDALSTSGSDFARNRPVRRRSSRSLENGAQTLNKAGASVQPGANPRQARKTFALPLPVSILKQKHFTVLTLAVGMLLMLLLVFGVNAFTSWLHFEQNNLTYGTPRTYQFNAVVGHNDSPNNPTHFMIINLNRHIEIVEFPGGDTTHARIYTGPVLLGDGENLTPVTATVKDVNGDGKPDLILHIQDQVVVFINTGTEFRPLQPGEHIDLSN
jgi:hypothetical protein